MGSLTKTPLSKLEAALFQAHDSYKKHHSTSQLRYEEACKVMPGGNTRTVLHTSPFPLTIASGQSCCLTTVDGRTYVDFLNEYTAGIYGHKHTVILEAIETALQKGWNYGGQSEDAQILAALICERFTAIDLVRFVNSGTEANMMALATALAFTGKTKIMIFDKAYHGSTISGNATPIGSGINLPHDFIVARYNDLDGLKATAQSLGPNELAAILVEPMLGSGGCFVATKEFLVCLRELASKHNALLIFDEVMTSRLSFGGLGAYLGVTPDMVTLGKYLGGGMSFGAFGGRYDIMELFDPRSNRLSHPGTFNNNVFSMAAGVAGARLLTSDVLQQLNDLGNEMRRRIEKVLAVHEIKGSIPNAPLLGDSCSNTEKERPPKMFVKGLGSLMCIHFAGLDQSILQALFFHHMLEHGCYIAQRGFISLSIELDVQNVTVFVEAVDRFCEIYQKDLRW